MKKSNKVKVFSGLLAVAAIGGALTFVKIPQVECQEIEVMYEAPMIQRKITGAEYLAENAGILSESSLENIKPDSELIEFRFDKPEGTELELLYDEVVGFNRETREVVRVCNNVPEGFILKEQLVGVRQLLLDNAVKTEIVLPIEEVKEDPKTGVKSTQYVLPEGYSLENRIIGFNPKTNEVIDVDVRKLPEGFVIKNVTTPYSVGVATIEEKTTYQKSLGSCIKDYVLGNK